MTTENLEALAASLSPATRHELRGPLSKLSLGAFLDLSMAGLVSRDPRKLNERGLRLRDYIKESTNA